MTQLQKTFASKPSRLPIALAAGAMALGVTAVVNTALARLAEHRNPPTGRFVTVRGVRLRNSSVEAAS